MRKMGVIFVVLIISPDQSILANLLELMYTFFIKRQQRGEAVDRRLDFCTLETSRDLVGTTWLSPLSCQIYSSTRPSHYRSLLCSWGPSRRSFSWISHNRYRSTTYGKALLGIRYQSSRTFNQSRQMCAYLPSRPCRGMETGRQPA